MTFPLKKTQESTHITEYIQPEEGGAKMTKSMSQECKQTGETSSK